MSRSTSVFAGVVLTAALALPACNTMGPEAVRSARIPYNQAVAATRDQQMLLNLVRLRYRDIPLFLDVGSVSTQYQMSYGIGASGRFEFDDSLNEHGINASGSLNFAEKPTITYTPLRGDKFVKQMMSPLPLETVFLLAQSGWSMNRLLRCCAQQINGVRNAPSASGPTPDYSPDYQQFQRLGELSRALQQAGTVQLVHVPRAGSETAMALRISADADPGVAGDLKDLLGVTGQGPDFPLVQTLGTRGGNELSVETRSLLGLMFYLSHAVEVPADDLAAGKVTVTQRADGSEFDWSELTGDLLRVRTSGGRPDSAYIAVKYRDVWFFIDDGDLSSKTTFALLSYLFALQSGERQTFTPALTLPL